MGNVGVVPNAGQIHAPDSFTGNGSTTAFTLTNAVTSDQSVIWIEGGVTQKAGVDYTIGGAGSKTLTRTTAPANGVACFALYLGVTLDINTPADSTITNAKVASDAAIVGTKLNPTISTDEVSTASGTTFSWTGLPAGVKKLVFAFEGLSLDDSDHFYFRLGDSGGIETSSYVSESCQWIGGGATTVTSTTTGLIIRGGNGLPTGYAQMTLQDDDAFTWTFGATYRLNTTTCAISAGQKSLSAELTQVQLLTPGGGNYDGGSITLHYYL